MDLHGVTDRDAESMAWIRPGAVLCIIGATAYSEGQGNHDFY